MCFSGGAKPIEAFQSVHAKKSLKALLWNILFIFLLIINSLTILPIKIS